MAAREFVKPWPPLPREEPELDPYVPYREPVADIVRGRYRIAGATHRGRSKHRPENEDSLSFPPDQNAEGTQAANPLLILADGAGRHVAGEEASGLVTRETPPQVEGNLQKDDTASSLSRAIGTSHAALYQKYKGSSLTTILASILGRDFVYVAHVGDSRFSLLRSGAFCFQTLDDNQYQSLVAAGMDPRGIKTESRNILTQSLGQSAKDAEGNYLDHPAQLDIHMAVVPVRAGDKLLLASDGLHGYVPEEDIVRVLKEAKSPSEAVTKLIDLALRYGGHDNVSVVVVSVAEETTQ